MPSLDGEHFAGGEYFDEFEFGVGAAAWASRFHVFALLDVADGRLIGNASPFALDRVALR
jgi:hypothetical protein